MAKFLKQNWILLSILGVAFIFRYFLISNLPGGLFPDEAANGLDVNSILQGKLQPFYERGNGREALFFYFLAISVAVFGRGPWQHHIISAGFGFFEVLATYFLTKRLFSKNAANLAVFFMATSSYAVTLSRTAFRANTVPFFGTLTMLFLVKCFQETDRRIKIRSAILAGISFGLGFYTYISFRMMIPLLLGFGVILLFGYRNKLKTVLSSLARYLWTFLMAFVVIFSWIGYYFLTHPGTFVGRAGQVSIFSKDLNQGDALGTFLTVLKKTIVAFFWEGDLNWRHNVSGYPFLSPLVSPFFAVGVIIFSLAIFFLLKQAWQKKIDSKIFYMSLCGAWFWLMLIPEITTAEGIPHGLRLSGVISTIFIFPAWIINEVWQRLKDRLSNNKDLALSLAAAFLFLLFAYNFILYFGIAASSSEYYYAFRSDLTEVSKYLNERNQKTKTYLSLDKFSVQTVDYLTTEKSQPYLLLDPAKTSEVKLKKGDQVVFTQSTLFDRLKFTQYHPRAKLLKTEQNKFGQIIMLVYQQL